MALGTRGDAWPNSESGHRSRCRASAAPLDTTHVAAALRAQRQFRMEQLTQLAAADARDAGRFGGLEVKVALQRAAAHALAEIEAALTRLQDGSYGSCTDCGQQISAARLEVLPAAALCMACRHRAGEHGSRRPVRVGVPGRPTS